MVYAGKESTAQGLFDVSRNVEEMLELLKVSISKHARLETDLDEGLPVVPGKRLTNFATCNESCHERVRGDKRNFIDAVIQT